MAGGSRGRGGRPKREGPRDRSSRNGVMPCIRAMCHTGGKTKARGRGTALTDNAESLKMDSWSTIWDILSTRFSTVIV